MNKKDFIDHVSANAGIKISKKDAESVIDAAFGVIGQGIKTEHRFTYPNFGTFTIRERLGPRRQKPPDRRQDENQGQQDRRLQARPDPARQPLGEHFAPLKTKRAATERGGGKS